MADELPLRKFMELARTFAAHLWPGEAPESLTIKFASGRKVSLPLVGFPPAPLPVPNGVHEPHPAPVDDFEPNDYQVEILVALEGKALKTDALAGQTSKDRRALFLESGLKGLIAVGWVKHDKRGYFRPDTPPE